MPRRYPTDMSWAHISPTMGGEIVSIDPGSNPYLQLLHTFSHDSPTAVANPQQCCDFCHRNFPSSEITEVVGPRADGWNDAYNSDVRSHVCKYCIPYNTWEDYFTRIRYSNSIKRAEFYGQHSSLVKSFLVKKSDVFRLVEEGTLFHCDLLGVLVLSEGNTMGRTTDGQQIWVEYAVNLSRPRYSLNESGLYEPAFQLPGYHSQSRDWFIPPGITLGVELETYCPDVKSTYQGKPEAIIGERDGSLNEEHGVEWIGPPLGFDDYQRDDGLWPTFLAYLRDKDVRPPKIPRGAGGSYGMHVSVGRKSLSIEEQLRFILFINCNQSFSELIAERTENRWANYNLKETSTAQRVVEWGEGDKYSATRVDKRRIEVRIFRATVSHYGFMKNIEYVHAALAFSKEADIMNLNVQEFSRWMNENAQRSSYPHLFSFLNRRHLLPGAII